MTENPPAAGERGAIAGYSAQYAIAAEVVRRNLRELRWIRVADPSAGVADDFQFSTGNLRHAIQVKWSQYPGPFSWAELFGTSHPTQSLFADLAEAWLRIRDAAEEEVRVHLCSNRFASSASPQSRTPLSGATAVGPRHFAAFLARSFQPVQGLIASGVDDWSNDQIQSVVADWDLPWRHVRAASGLSDSDFMGFLGAFEVQLGMGDPRELLSDAAQLADQSHIAQTLQRIVGSADYRTRLSRDELLQELGWSARLAYRHPHRFPVPDVYIQNAAAMSSLRQALAAHESGYLAVVGAAGTGKSTLLESFRVDAAVVRYYAFVPDSPEPVSGRGEAQAFLHDLNLALQESGLHSRPYGADLTGQRAVLGSLLEDAGHRFNRSGRATIVVVDGLDHIAREQSPTRSLVEELPPSEMLPPGVYLAIGTQSTDVLPTRISEAIVDSRRIEVPPLSQNEVDRVINKSGLNAWISPAVREGIQNEGDGHPLALTYLLQDLAHIEDVETGNEDRNRMALDALGTVAPYRGSVQRRYAGYLESVSGDISMMNLLAVLARIRAPIQVEWVASWSSFDLAQTFTAKAYPFFSRSDDGWHFIHNSFRLYLIEHTSSLAGNYSEELNRAHYARTADVCKASSSPAYRDEELSHRYMAGQIERVVELAKPAALRARLFELRPSRLVRSQASIALRAAAELGDLDALAPLLLLLAELAQRDHVLEPLALAEAAVFVLPPDELREHFLGGSRLVVDDADAYRAAAQLARHGSFKLADELVKAARDPRTALSQTTRQRRRVDAVSAWAEAHFLLGGLPRVLASLDSLDSLDYRSPQGDGHSNDYEEEDGTDSNLGIRQRALARCVELAIETRDHSTLDSLTELITAMGDANWIARVHVICARAASEDGMASEVLRHGQALVSLDGAGSATRPANRGVDSSPGKTRRHMITYSLRLMMLELVLKTQLGDLLDLNDLVDFPLTSEWPDSSASSDGIAPFLQYLSVLRTQRVLPAAKTQMMPDGPADTDSRGAGRRRFRHALSALAEIETIPLSADDESPRYKAIGFLADPIIRLLEVPNRDTHDWSAWYQIRDATPQTWERLLRSAQRISSEHLDQILNEFEAAWTSETRSLFWHPDHRTHIVRWVAVNHRERAAWVLSMLATIDAQINEAAWDVHDRVDTWIKQSRSWAMAGDNSRARSALRSAVVNGWGPSQNDESEQLAHYAEWLRLALRTSTLDATAFKAEAVEFASRILQSSIDASSQAEAAARTIIGVAFEADINLACDLAEYFCEQGVIDESTSLGTISRGLAMNGHGFAAIAIYCHMLLPTTRFVPPATRDELRGIAAAIGALPELENAESLWLSSAMEEAAETESPTPIPSDPPELITPPRSLTILLGQMRSTSRGGLEEGVLKSWEEALEDATGLPPRAVAEALVAEARRLGMTSSFMGRLIAICAEVGGKDVACSALSEALSTLPANGWRRQYDGGTRLQLLTAALADGSPPLQRIAVADFAGAVASGALSADIPTNELVKVMRILTSDKAVGDAWFIGRQSLDVFAPIGDHSSLTLSPETDPAIAIAKWVSNFVGHPTRTVDFGARKVLEALLVDTGEAAEFVLSGLVREGGWRAEGSLTVLLRSANRGRVLGIETVEVADVATQSVDLIVRTLARLLVSSAGRKFRQAPHRNLPSVLQMSFPPLSAYKSQLLDAEGVPVVDLTNPLEVVAPYDELLVQLAARTELEESALLHYASELARSQQDPWLADGHKGQAARLKRRGQRLIYRPWALMVGRRAMAMIAALAEDSGLLTSQSHLAIDMGLLDNVFAPIPQSLDASTPLPWRPDSAYRYDTQGWISETADATARYAEEQRKGAVFVLAERGEWRSLAWGSPRETRTIVPLIGANTVGLQLMREASVITEEVGARAYAEFDSGGDSLVLRSTDFLSDPEHALWIAMNPAAARRLGWILSDTVPFEWHGKNGNWKARTVLRVRGDLGFHPPADEYVGSTWQVVLSDSGKKDVLKSAPELARQLRVARTAPERAGGETGSAVVELT